MAESSDHGLIPDGLNQYDVCIIHSGSDTERRLENFIRNKLDALKLKCGPMNSDRTSGVDTAIFNDNLKTIKLSKKAVLIFSSNSTQRRRCRFERLFALHLRAQGAHPIVIPVVFGLTSVPDKYSVSQEVVVEKSNNWCYKLLRALTNDTVDLKGKISDDSFVNEGREIIDMNVPLTKEEMLDESDDFDEFGTAFDSMCFQFFDEVLKSEDSNFVNYELQEICDLQDTLCQKLTSSSLTTRMEFLRRNTNSGLFHFIGQMGLNNVHKLLMNGCGMSIQNDLISLKWKTFENNLVCSSVTLADIVNFSKFLGIKRISIKFDKYSQDKIEKHYGENWQQLLVTFSERILKQRFNDSANEMLTYRVKINGIAGKNTKKKVNKTGRNIYIQNFVQHVDEFQSLANRLKTYHNWPSHYMAKPLDLAKAGFIYAGHGDTITCYSCNQSLYGIIQDSHEETYFRVVTRHCFWNENCKHLQSLPEYNFIKSVANLINQVFKTHISDGILYTDTDIRLETFDSQLSTDRCFEFAQAGFFQKFWENYNLAIECFCCGMSIHSIKLSQDPWVEHIRWSPHCEYVLSIKGQKFVDSIRQVLETEDDGDVFTEVILETFVIRKEKEQNQGSENTEAVCIEDIELD